MTESGTYARVTKTLCICVSQESSDRLCDKEGESRLDCTGETVPVGDTCLHSATPGSISWQEVTILSGRSH